MIVRSVEKARGCGFRKPSASGVGIYLIGPAQGSPCGKLPLPLHRCPTCDQGIKPARAWTWIEPRKLFAPGACKLQDNRLLCAACPLGGAMPEGRHGLLWVGEAFYPTPHDFQREAQAMGISRKLSALPKGFALGQTWVYLAHRQAIVTEDGPVAGIFSCFRPTGVDLVIDPDASEAPERAVRLAEQIGDGARIIQVVRDEAVQQELFHEEASP